MTTWIKANDEPPPKNHKIIFYHEDYNSMMICKWVEGGAYGQSSWFVENEKFEVHEYTHWMLAPDAPKKS